MAVPGNPQPPVSNKWSNPDGTPSQAFGQYMTKLQLDVTNINSPFSVTGAGGGFIITNSDKFKVLVASGGYYGIFLNATSGYDANFLVTIYNDDTRGKKIVPDSLTAFILWPQQTVRIFNTGSGWGVDPFNQRWTPVSVPGNQFYVNATLGDDANDGLATGTGAFKTIQKAMDTIQASVDVTHQGANIQLDDGTHNVGGGVNCAFSMDNDQIVIQGNAVTPANVVVKGDALSTIFTVQDHATLSIADMALDGSNGSVTGVLSRQFAIADVSNILFVNFTAGTTMALENHASMGVVGDLTWAGNFAIGVEVGDQSFFAAGGGITLHVPAVTATYFLLVQDISKVTGGCTVIDAGLTGQKYSADYNSVIRSNGTTFPGTVGGTATNGSFYI